MSFLLRAHGRVFTRRGTEVIASCDMVLDSLYLSLGALHLFEKGTVGMDRLDV
jgi:hypothetical protein